MRRPIKDRLFENTVVVEDCWIWTAGTNSKGRAKIKIDGKYELVSRTSFTLFKGIIPEGHNVLHTCDDTLCWKPSHLFSGTQSDNIKDCVAKGRHRHNYNPLTSFGGKNVKKISL